jgi:Aspartyl protease
VAVVACLLLSVASADGERKPSSGQPPNREDRFSVVVSDGWALLVDGASGSTWNLATKRDGTPVWVPLARNGNKSSSMWAPLRRGERLGDATSPLVQPMRAYLEREGYSRIKLSRTIFGYLTVRAKINGTELNFIVDSGATRTHLDRKRTEALHLNWSSSGQGNQNPADSDAGATTVVQSIEFGPFHTGIMTVGAHDLGLYNQRAKDRGEQLFDGVVGADVLAASWAVVDYRSCNLYLFDRRTDD